MRRAGIAAALIVSACSFAHAQGSREVRRHGTIPTVQNIQAGFAGGAREVGFRDFTLTNEQQARLLDAGFLRQIGGVIPPREEAKVDIRAITAEGQRFELRVERKEDDALRIRIEGARFTDAAGARALVESLKNNFERVEVRGIDANGDRLRLEARAGAVIRDEFRPERRNGDRRAERDERKREERAEREERRERREKPERAERHEREDRHDRGDRGREDRDHGKDHRGRD